MHGILGRNAPIQLVHERQERRTHSLGPGPQLQDIQPAVATFDFADVGLPESKNLSQRRLRHASTLARLAQQGEEGVGLI